jgi:hypothetical protein
MALESDLYAALIADATLAGIIDGRVYPQLIPQDSDLPALAYQRISGQADTVHAGDNGFRRARIQITATAATYSQAKQLQDALTTALHGINGALGGGSTLVQYCKLSNVIDGYGTNARQQTVRLDFSIFYK